MVSARIISTVVLAVAVLATTALGVNQVRVFVPADPHHGAQELVVGAPGEIWIEVTCEEELQAVQVVMEFTSSGGGDLWNPIVKEDINYTLPEPYLNTDLFGSYQTGDWADTITVVGLAFSPDQNLPPGTYLFAKITVTPTVAGTAVLADATVYDNPTMYVVASNGQPLHPDLQMPSISVADSYDCNGNGISDTYELAMGTAFDCNNNDLLDECDIAFGVEPDCNDNGIPDGCDMAEGGQDCNANLIPDECDPDYNLNGIPDDCEGFLDCNMNGVSDAVDISSGFSADTNTNGVPDECEGLAGNFVRIYVPPDIQHGSQELVLGQPGRVVMALVNDVEIDAAVVPFEFNSADGTPLWAPLTNEDGHFIFPLGGPDIRTFLTHRQGAPWPDTLTVLHVFFGGSSLPPGIHPIFEMTVVPTGLGTVSWAGAPLPPDPSPPAYVISSTGSEFPVTVMGADVTIIEAGDCNHNGIPDAVELGDGSASDCNANWVIDECEIADGSVPDCNSNGVPDECDPDLNENGIPDDCEGGEGEDCNYNGVPDLVDISTGSSADVNTNGVPDECEGLAGNFVSIFVPPAQQLVLGRPGDIIVAVVNDVAIEAAAIPFRYNSVDGTPLWGTVGETEVEFYDPTPFANLLTSRQGGNWPDTLTVLQLLFTGGAVPVGFNPVCRITVTPTAEGTATFEAAPTPPTLAPVALVAAADGSDILVDIMADPVTVTLSCCDGRVGDVNQVGGDEPTIGDIALLIDYLFISGAPLACLTEADINQSGGPNPTYDDITIGDASRLIAYLFIDGTPLLGCF